MNDTINYQVLTIGSVTFDTLSLLVGALCGVTLIGLILLHRFKVVNAKTALDIDALEDEKSDLNEALQKTREDLIRTQAEKEALATQIDLRKSDEKLFEAQFENLAHKIFEEKTNKFKEVNQESLGHILNPLKERLNDFQKKVDDSFGNQAKEQFSLKEQIGLMIESKDQLTSHTKNLTDALKGDSKTQGDWGEVILERILSDVGLRKDIDYITQGAGVGMKHVETGAALKPDVIVNLPDSKHVIIDSKVSLTHYERWNSETDDSQRDGHLKEFIASVKQHVKDLEKRKYQATDKLGTPDFVLMFMPIEYAYMVALQQDNELHSFAWNRGVAIVCPSTLHSSLRTIASLWRLVHQNQNAVEIAQKGGALYDKMANFVTDMQSIGKNIKTLEGSYDGAMKKLSNGTGNILKRTEDLKELGAKATKSLPADLVKPEGHDDASDSKKAPVNENSEIKIA